MFKKFILSLFLMFFSIAAFTQSGPNCPTVCFGPGGSFTSGSLTISANTYYSSIKINSGATLTVESGATLYVGAVGTAVGTQVVDFQNGCTVLIKSGGSLVVNGKLNNSNNSNGVAFNGTVAVTGNVTAGTGSTITGTGTIQTTGSISGAGSVFNSTVGCTSSCFFPTNCIVPTITSTPATCSAAGTSTISNYSSSNTYVFNPATAGISINSSGLISGMTIGTSYTVTSGNGSCTSVASASFSNSGMLTPSAPTLGTPTQPTCAVSTGTVTVTAPATGTGISYTITGTSPIVSAVSNATGVFSALTPGSYNVTTTNASGCTSGVSSVTINPKETKTWNGFAWSGPYTGAAAPTSDQNIVFDGDYPPIVDPNVDIAGCSCQVNALRDVIIKTGHTLTITNEVNVDGFLTFEDKASLVQINNVTNTGDIDYIRTTSTGIYNTDYIYWSSPVQDITLGDVSKDLSNNYYSYEPTALGEDWKEESSSTAMISGNGYIISGPEYSPLVLPGNKYTATFTGVPNNGHYEITPIFADKSYLLGNPYPSALDADTFLADNANVLNGTLYFWTHSTDMQDRNLISGTAGSGAYAYTSNDYATYNATGGVGIDSGTTTAPAPIGSNVHLDANTSTPSGKIAAGQGFFASTKTTITGSKIVFDNTMRVGVNSITGDNSQFFKTKNSNGKTAKVIEKNRIWLNMTNTQGAFKQTLVGYITDATNGIDDRFDGESFDGNDFIDFYSMNQDLNLTIQGRALPFNENDEVPLGFKTTINGAFTINIDQVDGLLTEQPVFIEDKLTNTTFDLKKGNYTFNTAAGTFNDRFVLKYTSKTLGVDVSNKEDGILAFYSNNYKTLIIKNNLLDTTVNSVTLFNIQGQKIENWDVSNMEQNKVQIPIKNLNSGVYIVKVSTTRGDSSKKIIVN